VLFSESGADEARLLRRPLAAKRLGFLLTVFHGDPCPVSASRTPRGHTLAMLDAGTFGLHLMAAARRRLSAPGRAARPRPRRRCGRGRRHPPQGLRCGGVVPGEEQCRPGARHTWAGVTRHRCRQGTVDEPCSKVFRANTFRARASIH